jgi:hypothetical protein
MAVVVAAAGVMTVGEDNNQQKAAVGVAKTADVAAAGAEVELAATAAAAAGAEAVAVAAAETAATVAAIAMAMAEGLEGGIGGGRTSLGFHIYNLATIWCKVGLCF